jgi:SMC interacting uncharacterized protein involved in chromosome segregation
MTQISLPFVGETTKKDSEEKKESAFAMVHEEELNRLEQFVEKLVKDYQALKVENNGLREQLRELQQQNMQNQEKVSALQNDRSVMHDRVTGMLGKIEEWEKKILSEKDPVSSSSKKKAAGGVAAPADSTFSLSGE